MPSVFVKNVSIFYNERPKKATNIESRSTDARQRVKLRDSGTAGLPHRNLYESFAHAGDLTPFSSVKKRASPPD
jgi:hypothetical protein